MKAAELADKYLAEKHAMQLATVADGQPWICTVYFVADGERNLYWASLPNRRHSQEIGSNPKVAAAIKVKGVKGEPVIGIQVEGLAERLEAPDKAIVQAYAKKFGRDAQWIKDMLQGSTQHRMYKLAPSAVYLFDEVNFPGGERQAV